jgi:hypothetical protein
MVDFGENKECEPKVNSNFGKILLVDDDPVIISSVMIIIDILTRSINGFVLEDRVDTAYNG